LQSRQNSRYVLDNIDPILHEPLLQAPAEVEDPDFAKLMQIANEDLSCWEQACSGEVNSYKKAIEG